MTWEQFDSACRQIATKIKQHPKTVTDIFGIPRGGLIPAVRLSHLLQLPLTSTISRRTLIVDDICDTGKTLNIYKIFPTNLTATLIYHKQSIIIPDFWIYEKGDVWCIFPWEQP